MSAQFTYSIFQKAMIVEEEFWQRGPHTVFLTKAGQLVGTYDALKAFQGTLSPIATPGGPIVPNQVYRGWDKHHIVEYVHLQNHGLERGLPESEDLPCVLIPETAHEQHLGRTLRQEDRWYSDLAELLKEYKDAYTIMGDYCGGGSSAIVQELMAVCRLLLVREGDGSKPPASEDDEEIASPAQPPVLATPLVRVEGIPVPFRDRVEALQWLRGFRRSASVTAEWRLLLAGHGRARLLSTLTDDQVMEQLAWRLATGELRAVLPKLPRHAGAAAPVVGGEAPAQETPVERPAPRPAAPGPPEDATFPPSHDGDSQAGSLRNAAEDGTPFCEECERAQRAQAGA